MESQIELSASTWSSIQKTFVSNAYSRSSVLEELENEMLDNQVPKEIEKGTIKTSLQKNPESSKLPLEMKCVCIHCYENDPPNLAQLFLDSNPYWTLHLYRPLYVQRKRSCQTYKRFRRFVPDDTEVPSVEQKHLRNAAQKHLKFDDSKRMLLDHWAPSNRRPRVVTGNLAQASAAQNPATKKSVQHQYPP